MRLLLALLLLLNLALYLVLGPFESAELALPGGVGNRGGSGLTLIAEADPAQLELARAPPSPIGAQDPPGGGTVRPEQAGSLVPSTVGQVPAVRGRVAICYSLGTLQDRLLVERVIGELTASGLAATVRTEERRGDLYGYWVLLPAQPSLEAAQALIGELQGRGIDSFVVGTGEYRNAVSLGFFHGRRAAEALETRIRAQGFSPRLVLRYRQETQYWLDFDEGASERFSDSEWARLGKAYPMLGRYVRDRG